MRKVISCYLVHEVINQLERRRFVIFDECIGFRRDYVKDERRYLLRYK